MKNFDIKFIKIVGIVFIIYSLYSMISLFFIYNKIPRFFNYQKILNIINFIYLFVLFMASIGLFFLKKWGKLLFIIAGFFIIIYKGIINFVWTYILKNFTNYSNESLMINSLNVNLTLIVSYILFSIILIFIIIKIIKLDFSENKNNDR